MGAGPEKSVMKASRKRVNATKSRHCELAI
jgi:hypothetical protein